MKHASKCGIQRKSHQEHSSISTILPTSVNWELATSFAITASKQNQIINASCRSATPPLRAMLQCGDRSAAAEGARGLSYMADRSIWNHFNRDAWYITISAINSATSNVLLIEPCWTGSGINNHANILNPVQLIHTQQNGNHRSKFCRSLTTIHRSTTTSNTLNNAVNFNECECSQSPSKLPSECMTLLVSADPATLLPFLDPVLVHSSCQGKQFY